MTQLPGIVNTTVFINNVLSTARARAAQDQAAADALDARTFDLVHDTHRRLDRIGRILALMDALDEFDNDD